MFRNSKAGFTLIELMITVVLVSILLGSITWVYTAGFKTFYNQEARTGIKGQAGRALSNLSQELRQAGPLTSAQQTQMTLTMDSDSNGVDETIQYTWTGTAGQSLNRIFTSTIPSATFTTPVVNAVNSLSFSYYDAGNNLLAFPVTASEVRLVAVDMTTASRDETFELRSKARLRNL